MLLEVEHFVATEPPARARAHAGHGRVNVDEAVGVRERQRPKDDGVEHGEDRGRGADAEGEREDGGNRECRLPRESAERVADFAGHDTSPFRAGAAVEDPSIDVSEAGAYLVDITEFSASSLRGGGWR